VLKIQTLLVEVWRIPLLILIRLISFVDYFYRRLANILVPYAYRREGHCLKCGRCCEEIGFETHTFYFDTPWLIRSFAWYQSFFNYLDLIETDPQEGLLIFKCRKILPDGRCGNYAWRAMFCREYPRSFNYFKKQPTLPWCGFYFVPQHSPRNQPREKAPESKH